MVCRAYSAALLTTLIRLADYSRQSCWA